MNKSDKRLEYEVSSLFLCCFVLTEKNKYIIF
ncbi:MAG: hypothetical protein H6Q67_1125 [Firmicutes bacterium]|nr:hypothetical protein [Bacillota bacterium]